LLYRFAFTALATSPPSALSLHDALPICVASLFIRAARSAVRVRDPVVHSVHSKFAPGEISSEPDRLACNAAAEEVVTPDEDAALAIAPHPVDVEDSREADGLVLISDRPLDLRLVLTCFLETLRLLLLRHLTESRTPEAIGLRLKHPRHVQLEMFERGGQQRDSVVAVDPGTKHQRVASAARGGYSRSVLHRSCQV